ncbi:D-amino-acid oxidase isoform X2 [Dendroctonus ponderosae]|uniref:FAD dependent oxidoreductase domain-containing protein n=1 Tax=Dendroctonus ponderosae TaxID=77166 RepID=A0AAR5PY07_DENPD|nr:D-amino-acid oxidase isoform X2 [Dendroctonus ponderosae]
MSKIAVIGCGAVGLTSALELQNKFGSCMRVTIFADKFSPNTTSDIAAGLWEPYLLADNSEFDVFRWSSRTYRFILKLWQEGEAKAAGICLQPVVNLSALKNYSCPKWVAATIGYNELSDGCLQSFSELYGQSFTGGFMFISFTWEAAVFLPYLQQKFLKIGGIIKERHIGSLNELEEFDAILNCTGLEARRLSNDETVVPIRGQIIRAEAPWLYFTYVIQSELEDQTCYVIPNAKSAVFGGTQQKSFRTTVSSSDSQRILRNVHKLLPQIAQARILQEIVGLRPSRPKVRLEAEFFKLATGKIVPVVHNYGHGGAGITLSIGCAQDAALLIGKVLKITSSKL